MYYLSVFVCCANFAFVFTLTNVPEEGSVNFPSRKPNPTYFESATRRATELQTTNSAVPPLSMIRRMNLINDEEEFIEQFVVSRTGRRLSRLTDGRHSSGDPDIEPHQIAVNYASFGNGRFGDGVAVDNTRYAGSDPRSQTETKKPPTPKFARCQPELRTVNLSDTKDPTLVYFPCCTRVDRCGGCCTHSSLSCQPTELEYKNFSVNVYKYVGDQKVEHLREKVVTVEVHKKCRCDCKIRARDCTPSQVYNEEECRCMCSNKEDERKCPNDKARLWNPSTCSCECREIYQCSTGLVFDQASCGCVPRSQLPPSYSFDRAFGYNAYNTYRET